MRKRLFGKSLGKIAGAAAALALGITLISASALTAEASAVPSASGEAQTQTQETGGGETESREVLNTGRTGSITVTLRDTETGEPVTGIDLTIFKVADVKVDNGFTFTYTKLFVDSDTELTQENVQTGELAVKLADLVKNERSSLAANPQAVGDDGKAIFSDLEVGLYLIGQKDADGYIDADGSSRKLDPFLVTVPANEDGVLIYDVDASPKAQLTASPTPAPVPKKSGGSTTTKTTTTSVTTKKLPQTGQLWWPVMALGCAGALLVIAGWAAKRKG